jgi:hypothetical protein
MRILEFCPFRQTIKIIPRLDNRDNRDKRDKRGHLDNLLKIL